MFLNSQGNASLSDFGPDETTIPGFLDNIRFNPTFSLTSIDADLSGIWATGGTVFHSTGQAEDWHGQLVMAPVPEPGSLALLGLGLAGLGLTRRRPT